MRHTNADGDLATVVERDGERCTFTDGDGHRCTATTWLELDHVVPRARNGTNEPTNLRVRCRAHDIVGPRRWRPSPSRPSFARRWRP